MFLIISIIVISCVGTLAHFLYDITNQNKVIGLFAAVNESTWEHIKIALTPTIVWSLVDGLLYGTNPNYFFAKLVSLVSIIVIIPLLFYGYKIIFKKESVILNILIFYIAIIVSQFIFYDILKLEPITFVSKYVVMVLLFVLFGSYLLLTLMPLKHFIFKDPITKKYGFKGHSDEFNIMKKK